MPAVLGGGGGGRVSGRTGPVFALVPNEGDLGRKVGEEATERVLGGVGLAASERVLGAGPLGSPFTVQFTLSIFGLGLSAGFWGKDYEASD